MRHKMTMTSRRELLSALKPLYAKATRKEREKLLDGFVTATGYNRKHATVLLNKSKSVDTTPRTRRKKYGSDVQDALVDIWKASNRICSKRLIPFLPTIIESLERFGHLSLSQDVKQKLLGLSPASMDRLLQQERKKYARRKSTTRPGYLLKKHIPVRTYADWNENVPGFFEADLVSHGGDSASGLFLQTLTMTDVRTGWTELSALLTKCEAGVLKAFSEVRNRLPFALLGLDTDNGSEFINHGVVKWCKEGNITFTRSREYKKNDQAFVEEKNGSIVRRLVGYDRFEGSESCQLLSALYEVSRLYINFFQPSLKLAEKQRDGGKITRHYLPAATPHRRLVECQVLSGDAHDRLNTMFTKLDPVQLLSEIERLQQEFWATAVKPTISAPPAQPACLVQAGLAPTVSAKPTPAIEIVPRRTRRKSGLDRKLRVISRASYPGQKKGRKTALDDVWEEVCSELTTRPNLSPREILALLAQRYPGRFRPTQLSTVTDKLLRWRFENGYDLELPKLQPGKKSNVDEVWKLALVELEQQPYLSTNALLAALIERHPCTVRKGHRTSLYERLRDWRKQHLPMTPADQGQQHCEVLLLESSPQHRPKAAVF